MPVPTVAFKDLRQDRSGRCLYIPFMLRHGAFVVPPERAAALDLSASRITTRGLTVSALLSGFAIQRLPVALGIWCSCMFIVFGMRFRLAQDLEPVTVAPGDLIKPERSWAAMGRRLGKSQLIGQLIVGALAAAFFLFGAARSPFMSGLFIGCVLIAGLMGLMSYAAWRSLRALPK